MLLLVLKLNLFDVYNITPLGCQFGLIHFLALVSFDNQDVRGEHLHRGVDLVCCCHSGPPVHLIISWCGVNLGKITKGQTHRKCCPRIRSALLSVLWRWHKVNVLFSVPHLCQKQPWGSGNTQLMMWRKQLRALPSLIESNKMPWCNCRDCHCDTAHYYIHICILREMQRIYFTWDFGWFRWWFT